MNVTLPVVASSENKVPVQGTHILANFSSLQTQRLRHSEEFRMFVDECILELNLNKVGEAYHDFEGNGFTAVVCLAESHLSIHTWPDRNYATFDVYLSNHTRDNSTRAESLFQGVCAFFSAEVLQLNRIFR